MTAAIYRQSDGEIRGRITAPESMIDIQPGEGEEFYLNCPDDATNIINGEPVVIIPPMQPLTADELVAAITAAVQDHLDATARTHNYDGILSLTSYVNSADPTFHAEGIAGAAWRDTCWRLCYTALADVEAGRRTMPTPDEAVSELPAMVWPDEMLTKV